MLWPIKYSRSPLNRVPISVSLQKPSALGPLGTLFAWRRPPQEWTATWTNEKTDFAIFAELYSVHVSLSHLQKIENIQNYFKSGIEMIAMDNWLRILSGVKNLKTKAPVMALPTKFHSKRPP